MFNKTSAACHHTGNKGSSIRIAALMLAMLMLAFMLSACRHNDDKPTTVEPTVYESPTPSMTPAPISYRQEEAVTLLDFIEPNSMPEYLSLGNGLIVCSWTDFDYNEETNEDASTTEVLLIDIVESEVISSASFDSSVQLIQRDFSDGRMLFLNYSSSTYYVLDSELNAIDEFQAPQYEILFSYDLSYYYQCKDYQLLKHDLNTGTETEIAIDCDLPISSIVAIHPTEDVIIARFTSSPYTQETCSGAIDAETGRLLALDATDYEPVITSDSYSYISYDYETSERTLIYGSTELGSPYYSATTHQLYMDLLDYSASSELEAFLDSKIIPDSNYMICSYDPDDPEDGSSSEGLYPYKSCLFSFGESISGCDLSVYGIGSVVRTCCYLPEEELFIVTIYADGEFSSYLIDPYAIEFTEVCTPKLIERPTNIDTAIVTEYNNLLEGGSLTDEYAAVREKADAIEAEFGIQILLSNQCELPVSYSSYEADMTTQLDNEIETIDATLDKLAEALRIYPEGFLEQFRTKNGMGGLRIMLVASIESEFGVVGYAYEQGIWNDIVMDIQLNDIRSTICHELWHCTENKIVSVNSDAFDDETWNENNPEGFSYFFSYTDYSIDVSQWTYYALENADGLYFVDAYSCTFATEDRARIMEHFTAHTAMTDELAKSPHILAKLRIMSDAIREVFDTTGWETPMWERYFAE